MPTLAMVAAVVLCIAAGNWQRSRMHGKEALRALHDLAAQSAPLDLAAAGAAFDYAGARYRSVIARGEFDATRQIYIDNRVYAGRAGYHIVAPLRLADGRNVLVNRGWVAAGPSRERLPAVPPPAGEVTVAGRLDLPEAYVELKDTGPAGAVWQNLDPSRFAAATGVAVLPVLVEQTEAPVPDDGLARVWPAPDFGVERHRIYMTQWYAFAGLAVVLWIALNWRRDSVRDGA